MSFQIVTERRLQKQMSPASVKQHMDKITARSVKSGRGSGWTYTIGRPDISREGDMALHKVAVTYKTTMNRDSVEAKWPKIVKAFAEAGCSGSLRANPWKVVQPTGFENMASEALEEHGRIERRKEMANEPKDLGKINLEPGDHFKGIFGRDPQLRRVMDALHLAERTDWVKRKNTLFDGPPGSGKSQLMIALGNMLGKEGEAWLRFDATSMTKAGVIELIIESKFVPPIIFIEEIEKCTEENLRWLLGVMDVRGEIRRTNYRVGNEAKNLNAMVIASANNVKLLKSMMAGALYSRFQNKIYCPSPEVDIMRQILLRECSEIKGDEAWVQPTIDFGMLKWGIDDPRDLINIMSCGGARLLSGEAQKDYEATMHPTEKRDLQRRKAKKEKRAVAAAATALASI